MDMHELKQIQLYRQHLTNKTDPITVAHDLCGIQCQFMVNAIHSLKIRCQDNIVIEDWFKCLTKNWTLRGTVHVFCKDDLPLFMYDDGIDNYLSREWSDEMCENRLWITAQRKQYFADYITKCVNEGIELREDIKIKCREAGMTPAEERFIFNAWGGLIAPMCKRGYILYKVQEKKTFEVCPQYIPMKKKEARKEQLCRYLKHIAPATINDIAYFFKYTKKEVRDLINELHVNNIVIGSKEYFYCGEIGNDYPEIPKCIFLAGFDQLLMAYQKNESVYLNQEYLRNIFNLAGIVMPSLLIDGKIVGKWRYKNKKLEITCFERLDTQKNIILDTAEKYWGNNIKTIQFIE